MVGREGGKATAGNRVIPSERGRAERDRRRVEERKREEEFKCTHIYMSGKERLALCSANSQIV